MSGIPARSEAHLHETVRDYVESPGIAEGYDLDFAGLPLFRYDCEFIDEYVVPRSRVLDLGCGTGRHLAHLEGRGVRAAGFDLSAHMLEEARLNLECAGQPRRLVRCDFCRLPIRPGARFDAVLLMFSTLGMVRGSAARTSLLASLRPYLAGGGYLLAHLHNRHHRSGPPAPLWKRLARRPPAPPKGLEAGDTILRDYRGLRRLYLHCFTADEIADLLAAAGYRLVELRPLNERRDGPYPGDDWEYRAHGFLVAAQPR